MSRNFHTDHVHTTPRDLASAARQGYASVVGTVDTSTEKPITGRSGDHLQFYVNVNESIRYQVDINTQSSDGTDVLVIVSDETLTPTPSDPPFGPPVFGVFPGPDTKLSYAGLGLTDAQFSAISDTRIESQLQAALGQAAFVAVYGMTFDDGGSDGKGIHETHLNPGRAGQDGAVAIYIAPDGQPPVRRWFFFKFGNESVS